MCDGSQHWTTSKELTTKSVIPYIDAWSLQNHSIHKRTKTKDGHTQFESWPASQMSLVQIFIFEQ